MTRIELVQRWAQAYYVTGIRELFHSNTMGEVPGDPQILQKDFEKTFEKYCSSPDFHERVLRFIEHNPTYLHGCSYENLRGISADRLSYLYVKSSDGYALLPLVDGRPAFTLPEDITYDVVALYKATNLTGIPYNINLQIDVVDSTHIRLQKRGDIPEWMCKLRGKLDTIALA